MSLGGNVLILELFGASVASSKSLGLFHSVLTFCHGVLVFCLVP